MNIITERYQGYEKKLFSVNGHESFVLEPHTYAEGRPWIWRTEFPGAFDTADMAMVARGWALAYHCVSNRYGDDESIGSMNDFHRVAVREFSLRKKTVLFGFSRGGLYAFNYACRYPELTAGVYLDAPVMNILSWPAGRGRGFGMPACWEECKRIYGLTEETAENFKGNPLDRISLFESLHIPLIMVAGDSDDEVPFEENGKIFAESYKGQPFKLIVKAGCGHHPHSLENPEPITEFIEKYCYEG